MTSYHIKANFPCKTLQRLVVERSMRSVFYEVITHRSKGIIILLAHENLFWLVNKLHNKSRSIDVFYRTILPPNPAQFVIFPAPCHNPWLLFSLVAFIWNTQVTIRLVVIMEHNMTVFYMLTRGPKLFFYIVVDRYNLIFMIIMK